MVADGQVLDLLTLKATLGTKLGDVGGPAYVAALTDGVPRSTNIAAYADVVRTHATARQMLAILGRAQARLCEDPVSAGNRLASKIASELQTISERSQTRVLRLVDDVEMVTRPEPEALVSGIATARSLLGLYGPSGVGKTFFALRLGVSVCTGLPFFGATVPEPGHVVHVLGEGAGRFGARIAAVKQDIGLDAITPIGYYTLPEPVDLLDTGAVQHLIDACRLVEPRLIIIDTVNRNMSGNESATDDMTSFVAGCDRLRTALECAVMPLHHCGWDPTRERGSTVLRGAMDVWMSLRRKDKGLVWACEKARDLNPFDDIRLNLVPAFGSAVLHCDATPKLTEADNQVLAALPSGGLTRAAWVKASSTPRPTAYRSIKKLLTRGLVIQDGDVYRPAEDTA